MGKKPNARCNGGNPASQNRNSRNSCRKLSKRPWGAWLCIKNVSWGDEKRASGIEIGLAPIIAIIILAVLLYRWNPFAQADEGVPSPNAAASR